MRTLVRAASFAVLLLGVACTARVGDAPTTDPRALRQLVEQARANRPAELTVHFEVRVDDDFSDAARTRWVLAWGPAGAKVATFASNRAALPGSETGWQFHRPSGQAMQWGPTGAKVSQDPASIQVGELPSEYEFFLGQFVMQDALGMPRDTRDAVALLADPATTVMPRTEVVAGEECVVAVLEHRTPAGDVQFTMRGFYAMHRGYAQAQFEFMRGDGSLMGQWTATGFHDLAPGATALPTGGIYQNWDATGQLAPVLHVTVVAPPEGGPAIAPSLHLHVTSAVNTGDASTP